MFTEVLRLSLRVMQGFGQKKAMLVLRLGANDDFFYLGSFLMGYTYYIIKIVLIETFGSGDVFHVIYFTDLANNSVQRHIVCLIGLTVSLSKYKPTTIILFQILRMKGQFKKILAERLIRKLHDLPISNVLKEHGQQVDVRQVLLQTGTDIAGPALSLSISVKQQLSILKVCCEPTGRQDASRSFAESYVILNTFLLYSLSFFG